MSDTEEWQPNPRRPQSYVSPPSNIVTPSPDLRDMALTVCSTMAQAFSVALDNAFMLDNDINHLDQTVQQKYVLANALSSTTSWRH